MQITKNDMVFTENFTTIHGGMVCEIPELISS